MTSWHSPALAGRGRGLTPPTLRVPFQRNEPRGGKKCGELRRLLIAQRARIWAEKTPVSFLMGLLSAVARLSMRETCTIGSAFGALMG